MKRVSPKLSFLLFSTCALLLALSGPADTEEKASKSQGTRKPLQVLFATAGEVRFLDQRAERVLSAGDRIPPEGRIETGNGRAVIEFPEHSTVTILENSALGLGYLLHDKNSTTFFLNLEGRPGQTFYQLSGSFPGKRFLELKTPTATAVLRGTALLTEIGTDSTTRFNAWNSTLEVSGKKDSEKVHPGEGLGLNADGTRFTKATLPKPPEPGAPKNEKVSLPVQLRWEPVAGAKSYQVTIAADEQMNEVRFLGTVAGEGSLTLSLLAPGKYFWEVQAIDQSGFRSSPRAPVPFEIERCR
jgi:hypothetical protein